MAGTVNKAIILGHLGKDPEMRSTQAGAKVANFSIATSDTWKDKDTGERKEKTYWHRVVIFNEALAGIAEKYLKKGSKVYVEGHMQTRQWEDKDGQTKYVTEVVLSGFQAKLVLLDSKGSGGVPPAESEDEYGHETTREAGQRREETAWDLKRSGADRGVPTSEQPVFDKELDDEVPF